MNHRNYSRGSIVGVAAALVLSWGLSTSPARADGEFLEPFEPDYPTGPVYETFTATLELLGFLRDSDDPGTATNDDRCITDAAAGLQIALAAQKAAFVVEEAVCNAIPEPASQAACFLLLIVPAEALVITEVGIAQCDFQDSSVDGAEIEAGYENTVKLIKLNTKIYEKQIEDNLLTCRQVVGLILPEASGGLNEWVRELVAQRIDQFEDAMGSHKRVNKAHNRLARGDFHFDLGDFRKAYRRYCDAYKALASGKFDSTHPGKGKGPKKP